VELFLFACRKGNDGALPPVEEMAWTLHLSEDKIVEDLHGLAEVGVVHEAGPGVWFVTHFQERQTSESFDRVKRYRERYRNGQRNGVVAAGSSTSTSSSESDSVSDSSSGEGVPGEGLQPKVPVKSPAKSPVLSGVFTGVLSGVEVPSRTPVDAMAHPDVRVFYAATGGRVPAVSQYAQVIDSVRYLRKTKGLDDQALKDYLTPFWLAWSGRKRQDGRPYDPASITWLIEWALNGSMRQAGKRWR
jgi:hypothetical protein